MVRVKSLSEGRPIWCDLMTPDPDAARAFYAAVLGCAYDISGEEFGGYAMARVDTAMTAGIGRPPPGQRFPSSWTVYFGSSDADASVQRITAAGWPGARSTRAMPRALRRAADDSRVGRRSRSSS